MKLSSRAGATATSSSSRPGSCCRKTRDGRSIAHEARTMRYVAEHGYPVPRIEEVRADGTEIVMERIDGPIMMDAMMRPPWKISSHLRMLADLLDRLHQISAPDWLPRMPDGGDRDVAPRSASAQRDHVAGGPVVIDWPNARGGDPMVDVAVSYALMACGRIPLPGPVAAVLHAVRSPALHRWFARRYVGAEFYRRVAEMAELKCFDTNMAPDEIRALRRLRAAQPEPEQPRLRDDGSPRSRHPSASASEPAHRCDASGAGRRGVSPSARRTLGAGGPARGQREMCFGPVVGARGTFGPWTVPSSPAPLARRIHDAAHLTGTFTLRSGVVSHEYFDKYRFESDPQLLADIAEGVCPARPGRDRRTGRARARRGPHRDDAVPGHSPARGVRAQSGQDLRNLPTCRGRRSRGHAPVHRRGRRHLGRCHPRRGIGAAGTGRAISGRSSASSIASPVDARSSPRRVWSCWRSTR